MINYLKSTLRRNLINARGWRTNRKIIVFESDDWGMIRTSSIIAQKELIKNGYNVSQCPYNDNDRLESDEDIEALGEVLLSVKDSLGNPAKFTISNGVANPDFKKINDDSFKNYYYQPFTETLKNQQDSQNVIKLFKEGVSHGIFQPQLHGREHINIRLWLQRLQQGDSKAIDAFQYNMFTVHHSGSISGRRDNLDAFGNDTVKGGNFDYEKIIKEAQQIFIKTWGFKSKSFIAPCYVWHPLLEKVLNNEGVKYIQGTHVQRIPIDNTSFKIKKKYHYTGQKNELGQHYMIRNCFFEPTESGRDKAIEKVLKEIQLSFFYKKPAIISSHRVNYIGSLNPDNRKQNLKLLKELFHKIIKLWPDVEFMSTDELGDLITKNK
jgi:hypothetical protein